MGSGILIIEVPCYISAHYVVRLRPMVVTSYGSIDMGSGDKTGHLLRQLAVLLKHQELVIFFSCIVIFSHFVSVVCLTLLIWHELPTS